MRYLCGLACEKSSVPIDINAKAKANKYLGGGGGIACTIISVSTNSMYIFVFGMNLLNNYISVPPKYITRNRLRFRELHGKIVWELFS